MKLAVAVPMKPFARRCDALLLLPADLPLLTPADIQALARLAEPHTRAIVIAPDRNYTGTNALLLRPPHIIPTHFGPKSFHQHRKLAHLTGVPLFFYHSRALTRDIDLPAHLVELPGGFLG